MEGRRAEVSSLATQTHPSGLEGQGTETETRHISKIGRRLRLSSGASSIAHLVVVQRVRVSERTRGRSAKGRAKGAPAGH